MSNIRIHDYSQPLKIDKVNIGTWEKHKYASIGYYWDEEILQKIINILSKYEDLFANTLFEMKGIAEQLEEMKIPLKSDANPVKQRPYRLNIKYKEKVKA